MNRIAFLMNRQASLKEQICDNLDLIVGSVGRSPAMKYHNLTTKVNQSCPVRNIKSVGLNLTFCYVALNETQLFLQEHEQDKH